MLTNFTCKTFLIQFQGLSIQATFQRTMDISNHQLIQLVKRSLQNMDDLKRGTNFFIFQKVIMDDLIKKDMKKNEDYLLPNQKLELFFDGWGG